LSPKIFDSLSMGLRSSTSFSPSLWYNLSWLASISTLMASFSLPTTQVNRILTGKEGRRVVAGWDAIPLVRVDGSKFGLPPANQTKRPMKLTTPGTPLQRRASHRASSEEGMGVLKMTDLPRLDGVRMIRVYDPISYITRSLSFQVTVAYARENTKMSRSRSAYSSARIPARPS